MKILLLPLTVLTGYFTLKTPSVELKGYFACQSALLDNKQGALSCYARTRRDCRHGAVILAYEKLLSKPDERVRYKIADTVQLKISYPGDKLAITTCAGPGGKPVKYFVLTGKDALGKKYLRNVRRVWGVNIQGHLVEVPLKTLRCLNGDFGAD